ncbi:hypothetical protein ACJJH9_12135 [Microbulbifer sp. DLAB2-AF]|uniref:hypothetical protein n=1 Tax=Microbulbifer sp. DLAB2-AF TaxID=3243395 RepID=UPI004039A5D5
MDISDSLKRAENSLRDLINFILLKQSGNNWHDSCGVSEKRIIQWKDRKEIDEKKFGYSDPRIIYYADFYDLKKFLKNAGIRVFRKYLENGKKLRFFSIY